MATIPEAARQVMALYPRIYFACHTRHVRDPQSHRLLSRHQASILDHLDEVDPITLNDLARHMGVTAGTMSLAIDRLERKGYVVRLRDTADRRRVHMRLTSAGVRVREANSVLDPARVEALVARLGDDEREAAIRGLALLANAGGQETGVRRQEAGDRRQETGDERQKTDHGRQTGDGRQKTGDGRQRTEEARQKTGDGRQRTEDGRQKTGDRSAS